MAEKRFAAAALDAAGLPTSGDPILIDTSSSITSMGFAKQEMQAGRKLPGAWVIDHAGNTTDDPNALYAEPKGALLPLGGLDAGYKGFGLGLARGGDDRGPVGARLREQREHGVALYPTIMPALVPWAEKLGVASPSPLAG